MRILEPELQKEYRFIVNIGQDNIPVDDWDIEGLLQAQAALTARELLQLLKDFNIHLDIDGFHTGDSIHVNRERQADIDNLIAEFPQYLETPLKEG